MYIQILQIIGGMKEGGGGGVTRGVASCARVGDHFGYFEA